MVLSLVPFALALLLNSTFAAGPRSGIKLHFQIVDIEGKGKGMVARRDFMVSYVAFSVCSTLLISFQSQETSSLRKPL